MDSNFISINNINNQNNFSEDNSYIGKLQENLILMGFDINMINKIISYFKIQTENEALDYLIKTEDGMWNHPFIKKQKVEEELNNSLEILSKSKILMGSVINKIRPNDSKEPKNRISNSFNPNIIENNFLNDSDICEICYEGKKFHKIKNFSLEDSKSRGIDIIKNNSRKNILIDDDEDEDDNNNILNNLNDNSQYNNNQINNVNNNLSEENEEEIIIGRNECPICLGEFENPLEIENCKHKFCFECFHSYLVDLIKHNKIDKIPCPKKNCHNNELSEEFFSNYLSDQEYFKFRQFKAQNLISKDPKKIFCPECDSYAQVEKGKEEYDSNNPKYRKTVLECKNGHKFCSCGRPLHENDCYREENIFKELIKKENIKRCPKCGFLIKKNKGCNHMTCGNPRCGYEFCWLCMNEAIPHHYEIGPCAGKQFIDPDSFQYMIQENCPYLKYVLLFLQYLWFTIVFITIFIIIPAFGIIFFSYFFIYEELNEEDFLNSSVRKIDFLICILLSFPCQSLIYNIFILVFLICFYYIHYVMFGIIAILIIFACCCFNECCCFRRNEWVAHLDENENNMIELDLRENNNNIENNEAV